SSFHDERRLAVAPRSRSRVSTLRSRGIAEMFVAKRADRETEAGFHTEKQGNRDQTEAAALRSIRARAGRARCARMGREERTKTNTTRSPGACFRALLSTHAPAAGRRPTCARDLREWSLSVRSPLLRFSVRTVAPSPSVLPCELCDPCVETTL